MVYLLDLYLSKLPPVAFEKDNLYWQPKQSVPTKSTDPWYNCQPVGKHKLQAMVASMCEEAGICERKTNHSLRVTGATTMYNSGVPEREIQERTGHRSLEALRTYEHTGEQQHQAVSNMLSSTVERPYTSHLSAVCRASTSRQIIHSSSVSSQSHSSIQYPSGLDLQGLFRAEHWGTLNIAPRGNFVLSVHLNRPQSVCEQIDEVVKEANAAICSKLFHVL